MPSASQVSAIAVPSFKADSHGGSVRHERRKSLLVFRMAVSCEQHFEARLG